ncbi:MAG TPA: ABC-type transport auxiliary lipoprotein family protein, partial [Gammaproteobacteria bacterium]
MTRTACWTLVVTLLLLAGCARIGPAKVGPLRGHLLEPVALPAAVAPAPAAPLLRLATVRAVQELDGTQMLYRNAGAEVAAYARNVWAAPPAEQVARWAVAALERAGGVAGVIAPGGRGVATLRLESELLALHHDHTVAPSRAVLELRVQLIAQPGQRVLTTRRLRAVAEAPSDDPDGGVAAANRALAEVLAELAA